MHNTETDIIVNLPATKMISMNKGVIVIVYIALQKREQHEAEIGEGEETIAEVSGFWRRYQVFFRSNVINHMRIMACSHLCGGAQSKCSDRY